nr:translation initiation factor IF-2-like [Pan paniscus]
MPGPAGECWVRGPARRQLLHWRQGCCSGPRARSGAFSLPVGPPARLGSAGAPRPRRSLRSAPPESPPPRPAALWSLRAPLAPAPAPGAHVTGASEHAPRGRSPRRPRAHTRARTRAPALPPRASARAPDPGGRGQRAEVRGRGEEPPCCFRLPGRRRWARRGRDSALGKPGVSARVPGLPSRVPAGKLFSSARKPRWGSEIAGRVRSKVKRLPELQGLQVSSFTSEQKERLHSDVPAKSRAHSCPVCHASSRVPEMIGLGPTSVHITKLTMLV